MFNCLRAFPLTSLSLLLSSALVAFKPDSMQPIKHLKLWPANVKTSQLNIVFNIIVKGGCWIYTAKLKHASSGSVIQRLYVRILWEDFFALLVLSKLVTVLVAFLYASTLVAFRQESTKND